MSSPQNLCSSSKFHLQKREKKRKFQNFVASTNGLNKHSYGEIKFVEIGRKSTYSPFVTTTYDADPSMIWNLLLRAWSLTPPSVVLAVFGNFGSHDQTWKSVTKGSWIITTGSSPFINIVDATTIAIVEMDKVKEKEKFYSSSTEGTFPLLQQPRKTKDASSTKPLDRNHSFFIFVEGSSENVTEFRNNVLYYFSTIPIGLDSTYTRFSTIPLVLNLISDQLEPIYHVSAKLKRLHTIVVHKSAPLSTTITKFMLDGRKSSVSDEEFSALNEQLPDSFLSIEKAKFVRESVLREEVQLLLYPPPLHSKRFDQFILENIASNDGYSIRAVLCLALKWKATDVIEKLILTKQEFSNLNEGFLQECLIMALTLDSPGFLEVLFQNEVQVYSALTAKVLYSLYDESLHNKYQRTASLKIVQNIIEKRFYIKKQNRQRRENLMKSISFALWVLTCHEVAQLYSIDIYVLSEIDGNTSFREAAFSPTQTDDKSNAQEHPERDVFFWCILTGRDELAQAVWRHGRDHTALALIASVIYGKMAKFIYENQHDVIEDIEKLARDWEQRATRVISSVNKINSEAAISLLTAKQQHLGGSSCLTLGFEGGKQDFMSSPPCQRSLDKIWRGKLKPYPAAYKIIFGFFFPLFIPCLGLIEGKAHNQPYTTAYNPTFSSETDHHTTFSPELEKVNNDSSVVRSDIELHSVGTSPSRLNSNKTKLASYVSSIVGFYCSPLIIQATHTIFRVIAIFTLSYVIIIMNNWKPKFWSMEIQLLVWYMFGNLCEIFRQFLSRNEMCLAACLKLWVYDRTQWVDSVVLSSFTIGMILLFYQDAISDYIWLNSKLCLSLCLLGLYIEITRSYNASKWQGPMMYMIRQMIRDTSVFLGLMGLIFFSYGVIFYSLRFEVQPTVSNSTKLQKNNTLTASFLFLVNDILREPYWQIYGNAMDSVTAAQTTLAGSIRAIVSGTYVLFSSILMVNLLVAMYSYTFDKIQERSYIIWSYNRYELIRYYSERPALASPFILISHIAGIVRYVLGKSQSKAYCANFAKNEMQLNREIEQEVFMELQNENDDGFETDTLIKQMRERQEVIEQKLDDLLATKRDD